MDCISQATLYFLINRCVAMSYMMPITANDSAIRKYDGKYVVVLKNLTFQC